MTDTATAEPAPERPTHPDITSALIAVQAAMGTAAKDSKGNYGRYADLASVNEAVLPLLAANGLAWICTPTIDGDLFVLKYGLFHESGSRIEGTYPLGNPNAEPQRIGGLITYARRYALSAVTGIAAAEDIDSMPPEETPRSTPRPTRPERPQQPVAPGRPIDTTPERLPQGLYDLSAIRIPEDARALYRKARSAGHLHLLVGVPGEDPLPLGEWLRRASEAVGGPTPEATPEGEDA